MTEVVEVKSDVQPSISISLGDRVKTALFGGLGTAAGFAFHFAYFGAHGYRTWHAEKAWKFIIIIGMSVIISTLIHLAEKRKEEVEKHEVAPKVSGSKKWLPLILLALLSAFGITIDELHKHTLVLGEEELNVVIPTWISFFFLGACITFFWSIGAWRTPKRASKMGFIGGLIAGTVYMIVTWYLLPKDLPYVKTILFVPILWALIGWFGGRIINKPGQLRAGAQLLVRFFITFLILFLLLGLFYTVIGWGFLWGSYIIRGILLIAAGWAIGLLAYPMSDVVLGFEESKFKPKYTPIVVTICLIVTGILVDRLCVWGDHELIRNIERWDSKRLDALAERIELMTLQGAYLNAKNKSGKTALQVADERGFLGTIVILRALGAEVNDEESRKIINRAFHDAAGMGDLLIAQHLLTGTEESPGADVNATDKDGNTALMTACYNNKVPMVKYLIEQKADPNIKNKSGVDAMVVAMHVRNFELVRMLLEAGAEKDFFQLLADAAYEGDLEKVEVFLQNKANVNEKNQAGATALMFAVAQGHVKVVQRLLREKGIEVDPKDRDGRTALMIAAMGGDNEIVKMLLKSGASVSAVDNIGWTPLGFAALNGHTQAAETLIDAGSDLSWINSNHVSILMAASIGGNGELVRFLINQGVDVNAVAKDHSTALIFAAKHGRIEVAKILYIEAKADSTIQDVQNQTAENYACTNQHQEICELLRISSQPPVEQ